MTNIFIGLILTLLDFNVNIGNSAIGLLPDFLGYFLIFKGVQELYSYDEELRKQESLFKIMILFSAVIYVMDLTGVWAILPSFVSIILGAVGIILNLVILYNIVKGIQKIETDRNWDLHGTRLWGYWLVLAIFQGGAYAVMKIYTPAVIGSIIFSLVVSILFIVEFYFCKRQFSFYVNGGFS